VVVSGYSYGKFDVCKFVNFAIGKFREGSLGVLHWGIVGSAKKLMLKFHLAAQRLRGGQLWCSGGFGWAILRKYPL